MDYVANGMHTGTHSSLGCASNNACKAVVVAGWQVHLLLLSPGELLSLHVLCRYKQAMQQPYAATAALNYYRAYLKNITTKPTASYLRSALACQVTCMCVCVCVCVCVFDYVFVCVHVYMLKADCTVSSMGVVDILS